MHKIFPLSFSISNSKTSLFLPFFQNIPLKSHFHILQWGYLILKWYFLHYFRDFRSLPRWFYPLKKVPLNNHILVIGLCIPNMELKQFQMQENQFQGLGKYYFRIRKYGIKFHFKIKKPYFKLRKALLKRGLERNGKNKNVLKFDLEKDVIIFLQKNL